MQDGMAVCENCGMKFSKEEVKKMVVELSGPIQIDGEVKVTGVDDADDLYRRAKDAERIGELESADATYKMATKKYPGDARLWLGWATVQVKLKLEESEKELKGDAYSEWSFNYSFGNSEWCDGIEKLYVRAQSLGGADDEAQQGLLWFGNQKELIIQKYKDKKRTVETYYYWCRANAEFLNSFPGTFAKEEALAFLLKRDVKEFRKELCSQISHFQWIVSFDSVQGNRIVLEYKVRGYEVPGRHLYKFPEGMTIEGDIRPLLDGFTYKKGLFSGKKVYSYASDPDKDKGPTFDE